MGDSAILGPNKEILHAYSDHIAWTEGRYGQMGYLIHDNPIGLSIARYGEWSGIELHYHLHFIDEDSVVLDVGANIGMHSLAYASKAREGRVLLFEPQPLLIALALETLGINDRTNVQGFCTAVSDQPGPALFRFPDYGSLGNYGMVSEVRDGDAAAGLTAVPTLTLDSLNLDRCDFIKIDAEGASVEVLRSAAKTVARFRPVIATEVLGVEDGWRIMEWFNALELDYTARFYRFSNYNAGNCKGDKANFFGVAEECGLLFVPAGREDTFAIDGLYTTTVTTLDELAREHQRTARYGDFTPFDRKHEVIGSLYVDLLRRMMPVYSTSVRTDVCVGDEGWGGAQSAIMAWDQGIDRVGGGGSAQPGQPWLDAVVAMIAQREQALEAGRTELSDARAKLAASEVALLEERHALTVQAEALLHQEQVVTRQTQDLADREDAVRQREQALADREDALHRREQALAAREAEVEAQSARILAQERILKLADASQLDRDQELASLARRQAEERERLSSRAMELEQLQAKLLAAAQRPA